jgi:hypothetical protein
MTLFLGARGGWVIGVFLDCEKPVGPSSLYCLACLAVVVAMSFV